MIRALAIKELREIGWIAAIGLAAYLFVVGAIISPGFARGMGDAPGFGSLFSQDRLFPFVHGSFAAAYTVISLVMVLAFGVRQTVGEAQGGTFSYLLHRPITWRSVFFTKMAVGVGLYLVVASLPVFILAAWAATPGTHPSPFEWSMTVPTWKTWIAAPIFYLATFLCGIRPAHWFGTRLLPLPAVVLPILVVVSVPAWLLVGLPVLLLTIALLLTSTLWVGATRDFS